jgi:hypothetical protein
MARAEMGANFSALTEMNQRCPSNMEQPEEDVGKTSLSNEMTQIQNMYHNVQNFNNQNTNTSSAMQ